MSPSWGSYKGVGPLRRNRRGKLQSRTDDRSPVQSGSPAPLDSTTSALVCTISPALFPVCVTVPLGIVLEFGTRSGVAALPMTTLPTDLHYDFMTIDYSFVVLRAIAVEGISQPLDDFEVLNWLPLSAT